MTTLRIALSQMNMTVGDIEGNCRKIAAGIEAARVEAADVVVFPELCVTGYPPEDLLLFPEFVREAMKALSGLGPLSKGMAAVVGCPYADLDLYNAAAFLCDGEIVGLHFKNFLPNYGVFDEDRYFAPGLASPVFVKDEFRLGVSICEDIWYPNGPHAAQALEGGAQVLINISASPYNKGKGAEREKMLSTRARDSLAYVAYCNLVGGQDELVFDGQSLIVGPRGEIVARAPQFEEALVLADLDLDTVLAARLGDPRGRKQSPQRSRSHPQILLALDRGRQAADRPDLPAAIAPTLDEVDEVHQALVLGTRDYVRKNGFEKAVVGLSGGVDSALVAVLATQALSSERVIGVSMPTRFSSELSLTDARQLSAGLGIEHRVIQIDDLFESVLRLLGPELRDGAHDIAEENIQARLRGMVLMALSNAYGWLVLTTGNKSEVGVGYSTLYGDTAGGFGVIKDVPKTLVYALCRHINAEAGTALIAEGILTKPPSAELRPNQKDSDSLPAYEILDPIMHAYVEKGRGLSDIVALGYARDDVRKVLALVSRSEYKRRQSPPGIKIMRRAFGRDWRLPITSHYKPEGN
jgi:NAD+ synthase (glutamine-hydrolysing)